MLKSSIFEIFDEDFNLDFDGMVEFFDAKYNMSVEFDIDTYSIEIYKEKSVSNPINVSNNIYKYNEMPINKLKSELIGKAFGGVDSYLYKEIIDIQKFKNGLNIEYIDRSSKVSSNNNIYYVNINLFNQLLNSGEYQIGELDKQYKDSPNKHKVQRNGLTPNDEELIDMAKSTTYRDSVLNALKHADTKRAKDILRDILYDNETRWEN